MHEMPWPRPLQVVTDFAHWQIVRVPLVSVLQEEEGVAKERERIYSEEYQFDSIVIKDLQKHYKTKGKIYEILTFRL